jgi:hypothetical protein
MNERMKVQSHAHEEKDVDVVSMFLAATILFLLGALICFAVWCLMRSLVATQYNREAARAPAAASAALFPQPRLEVKPAVDLQKLRAAEDERLNSYGWLDRGANVVHIPIDRAVQLMLERGLPDVGGGQTPLQFMQARPQEISAPGQQP